MSLDGAAILFLFLKHFNIIQYISIFYSLSLNDNSPIRGSPNGVGHILVEKKLCGGVMWTWSSSLLSCSGVLASWLCGLRTFVLKKWYGRICEYIRIKKSIRTNIRIYSYQRIWYEQIFVAENIRIYSNIRIFVTLWSKNFSVDLDQTLFCFLECIRWIRFYHGAQISMSNTVCKIMHYA